MFISFVSLEDFRNDPLARGKVRAATRQEVYNYVQKYRLLDYAANH